MKKVWISVILPVFLLAGCTQQPAEPVVEVHSIETLAEQEQIYQTLRCPLYGYDSIIIKPIEVDDQSWYDRDGSEDVERYLDLSIRKVVLEEFNIVTEPDENTATMQISLIDADSKPFPLADNEGETIRGVALKITFSDSLSDKAIFSFAQGSERRPISFAAMSRWHIAVRIIDRWLGELETVLLCEEFLEENDNNQVDEQSNED